MLGKPTAPGRGYTHWRKRSGPPVTLRTNMAFEAVSEAKAKGPVADLAAALWATGPALPVKLLWQCFGYPPVALARDRTLDGPAAIQRHSIGLLAPLGALDTRGELAAAASIVLEAHQYHPLRGCLLRFLPDSHDPPM